MSVDVSVIIPTYNRRDSLLRTLESLTQQTYSSDCFEVIIIDDGSEPGNDTVVADSYAFDLHYYWQKNSGVTLARNHGSQQSHGEVLIFIDDDITLTPGTLSALTQEINQYPQAIILGTLLFPESIKQATPFSRIYLIQPDPAREDRSIQPYECMTGLLAIKREDFSRIGGFADPTDGKGWPNWDDVDFGYRAHLQGYQLWRSGAAVAYHHDYAAKEYAVHKERLHRAGRSAVLLLQKYPALEQIVPLFRDRSIVSWRSDPPNIILRKLWRSVMAWSVTMTIMDRFIAFLERRRIASGVLKRLYTWVISSSITIGMRQGIREFGGWRQGHHQK